MDLLQLWQVLGIEVCSLFLPFLAPWLVISDKLNKEGAPNVPGKTPQVWHKPAGSASPISILALVCLLFRLHVARPPCTVSPETGTDDSSADRKLVFPLASKQLKTRDFRELRSLVSTDAVPQEPLIIRRIFLEPLVNELCFCLCGNSSASSCICSPVPTAVCCRGAGPCFPYKPPVSRKGQHVWFLAKLSFECQLLTTAIAVEHGQDTSRAGEEHARR